MKKTITSLFVVASFLISTPVWAAFSDVASSHLNQDAVDYVKQQGIVQGYADGTFRPDQTINRAEFTKIIMEAQFDPAEVEACDETFFDDVPQGEWFAKYVCLAKDEGIIEGYPDGTFKPAQNISFAEASKIIVNSFGFEVGTDAIWYKPFVRQLGNMSAVPTTIDRFEKNITRGEMAEMIYRLKADIRSKATRTYAELSGEPEEIFETVMIEGEAVAGQNSFLYPFKESDYQTAVDSGQLVVLYFTANWCPLCKVELIELKAAFDELQSDQIIGFILHTRDNVTSDEEEDVAREHGVAYQHTKVFIKNGERVLKAPDTWSKDRYLGEIANFL